MTMPDAMEIRLTDYLARGTTPAALTGPMRAQLLSALGAGDAASTPITSGTTPLIAYGAGPAGANPQSNQAVLRWEGLPNPTTVAGFRIVDSAATPFPTLDNIPRTGGSVTVVDGILEVPIGQLSTTSS